MAADFEKFFLKSKYLDKLFIHYVIILIIVCVVYCNSSEECAKNNCVHGRCEAGKCVCDPGFRGTSCNSCGGRIRLSGAEGSISDGPGNYTEDNQCSWLIDASAVIPLHSNASSSSSDAEHPTIRLQLGHFATECSWDHLYVYDGDSVYAPLLAVYSGLVVSDGYRSTVVPELVTTSGFALVHFYSDAAYNLTGFDVNYRVGGCAGGLNSSGSWIECSGRGSCVGGACHCEGGWAGPDCGRRTCPRHCSSNGYCNTEHGACDCHPQFTGSDCSESVQAVHWRALQFLLPSESSAFLSPLPYQRTDASQHHRSNGGGGNRHSHARRALRRSFGPDGEVFRLAGEVPDDRGRFPPPRRRRYHRATVYERPGYRCCQQSALTITGDTPPSDNHGGGTTTSSVGRSPETVRDGASTFGSSSMDGPGSDNNNIYNGDDATLFEDAVRPLASVFDQEKKSIASFGQKHASDAVHEVHSIPALGDGRHERESYHPETKEIRRSPRSTRDDVNNLTEMGGDGVVSSLGHTDGGDGVGSSLGHTDGGDGVVSSLVHTDGGDGVGSSLGHTDGSDGVVTSLGHTEGGDGVGSRLERTDGGDSVGSSQWHAEGGSGAHRSDDINLNDDDSSRSGSSIISSINKINNNEALTDNNDFFPTGGYFSPKYGFEFLGEEQQKMFDPRDFGIVMTTFNELPAMIAGGEGSSSEGIFGLAGAVDESVNYGVRVEQNPSESVLPLQDVVRTDPDLSAWFESGSAPQQDLVASRSKAITEDNRHHHSTEGRESNLPEQQHQADRYQKPNVQYKIDTNTISMLRPSSAPHHSRFRDLHPTMASAAPYLSREFISGPTPWMSLPLPVRIPSHWWWRHQQQYMQLVLPIPRQHHPSLPPGPLPHPQVGAGGMNVPLPLYQDPNASLLHLGFPGTNHPLVFHPPMPPPPFRHLRLRSTPWRQDHPPSQFVRVPIPPGIPRHSVQSPRHEPLQYTARQLQQLSRVGLGIQNQPNFEIRHVDERNPSDGSTRSNQLRMNQPSFVSESGHFGSSRFDSKNAELLENQFFLDESLNSNHLIQQDKDILGFHSRAGEISKSSTSSRPNIDPMNTSPPSPPLEKNTDTPQFLHKHPQGQGTLSSIFDSSSSNPSPVSDPSRLRVKRSPLSRSADDFLVSNFPPDLHSEPSGGDLPSTRSLHHPLLERSSMASVVVGDVVWVLGGYSFTPLPFVLRYNVSEGVVEGVVAKGNREPSSRHGHTALYHNGSVYVFGGMLLDGVVTPQLWRFSPDSLKWSHLGTRRGDGNGGGGNPRHPWDGVSPKGGARIASTGKRSAGNKRGQRNSEERSPSAGVAAEIHDQGDEFELFGGGDNTTEVVKGGSGSHEEQEEDFGAYLKRKYPDIYEAQFHSQHNKSFSPESDVGEEVAALAKQLSAKESSSAKIDEDATNEVKIRKDIWNKLFSSSSEDPHNRWFPQHFAEGGSDDLSVPESNDAEEGSGSSDGSVVAHAIHNIRKRMAQAVGNPKGSNVGDEDVEEDSSGGVTSSSKFSHASLAEDDHHHDDHPLKGSTFLGDGADEDQEEGSPSSRLYSDSPSSNSLNANHNTDGGSFFGGGDCRRRGSGLCAPIGVVGAGAVLIPSEDQEALDDAVMLVIFGYSPPYGFINAVQEYHFSSNSWRLVPCGGAIVRGRYGHTVTWDAVSRLVLVHGGLVAATSTSNVVNGLLAYSHATRNWHILPPSPSSVYLHSAAVLSPGALVVFGGNSHNDTSVSHSARCYTHASSLYDTVCGYWAEGVPRPRPTELGVDTARYGHNMVVMRAPHSIQPSSIPSPEGGDKDHNKHSGVSSSSSVSASATVGLVLGGFNGRMLGTALVLHHGLCQRHSGARDCLNAYPGVKCVWNSVLSQCELYDPEKDESSYTICLHELPSRDSTSSGSSRKRSSEPSVPAPPPTTAGSRLTALFAHHHRNDSLSLCRLQVDCLSCLFTSFGCVWCGTGGCQYEKCVAPKSKAVSIPSECSPGAEFPYRCRALSSCQHCHQSRFLSPGQQAHSCVWLSNNQCAHNNSTASSYPATTTDNAAPDAVEGGRIVSSSSSDLSNAGLKADELGKMSGDEATSTVTPTAVSVPSSTAAVDAMDVVPQKSRACHQPPCHQSTTCGNCTMGQCMWCFSQQRCVNNNSYLVSFPYGSCREWTTSPRSCLAIKHGENGCSLQRSCSSCQSSVGCGWCDDGSGSGTGACVAGGAAGPRHPHTGDPAPAACPRHRWHFTTCPACNCNGHSRCRGLDSSLSPTEGGGNQLPVSGDRTPAPPFSSAGGAEDGFEPSECVQPCGNNTEGPHCQYCRPTFYGVAINGGLCKPCACNDHGVHCDRDTGRCFCSTKGVTGDHCQRCDTQNNYFGDPLNGSCFYDLQIDYQFTFNLSKAEDRHVRQINFFNVPTKPNVDTDFDISSSKPARLKISAKETGGHEVWVVRNFTGTRIKRRFSHTDYAFGTPDNNTTFHVYVYNFTPPVEIVVSFSQYPKLNLLGFFYIFLLCFLCLLVVAALLWKIKQKYDIYSRRQRLMVEMEAMASRPFKPVLLELQPHQYPPPADHHTTPPHSPSPLTARHTNGGAHHTASKNLNPPSPMASPIALEVCEGGRAAVLSLLVQLPTGGRDYMPYLHPGGLAIASTLVSLGSHRNGAAGGGHNTDPLTLTGGGTSLSSTNSNPTTVTTTGHHRGGEGGGVNTGVEGTNPSSPVVPKSSSIIRSGRGVSFQLPEGSQQPGTATTSCNSTTSSDKPSRRPRNCSKSGSGAVAVGTKSDHVTADSVNVGTSTTVEVVGAVAGFSPTSSSESNSSKRSTSSTNTNSKDEASTTGSSSGSPQPLSVANSNASIDVVVTNSIVNCSNTSSSPSTSSLRHISDLPVTICNNINDINHNNKITSINSSSSSSVNCILNSRIADDRYDAGTTLRSSSINNNNSSSHVSYAPAALPQATLSPTAGDALTIVNTNALHCDPHEGEEGAHAAATCILNTARTSPLLSAGEVRRQSSPGSKVKVEAVTIANHHADETVGLRENSSSSQLRRLKEPTAPFSAYRSRTTKQDQSPSVCLTSSPEVLSNTARRQRLPPTGREEDSCPDVPAGEFSPAWGSPVSSSRPATAPCSHGVASISSSNGVGHLGRPVVPRTSLTTSVDLSSSRVSTHPSSVTVNGKQLATCI